MKALKVLQEYQKKLESADIYDKYSALMFALQIPSICGRIEFRNTEENIVKELYGKIGHVRDKNMYAYWMQKHKDAFRNVMLCNDKSFDHMIKAIYSLRCTLTHEGLVKTEETEVVLVDSDIGSMDTGSMLFISIKQFCQIFFDEAEIIFTKYSTPFSNFDTLGMDNSRFSDLFNHVAHKYREFWSKYSQDDKTANMLFDLVFLRYPDMLEKVRAYFDKSPDDEYIIAEFGLKYSLVTIDNRFFFNKTYICSGREVSGIECRFSKIDFNRMQEVHDALMDYAHNVDKEIAEYMKKEESHPTLSA